MSRREGLGGIRRPGAVLRADEARRNDRKGGTVRRSALLVGATAGLAACLVLAIMFGGTAAASPQQGSGKVVFFSNQLAQVSEVQAGRGSISLLGALHGDYLVIQNRLQDLTPVANQLRRSGIPRQLMTLGKLGTRRQLYIPWMQATYIMVANRQALRYLPRGADVQRLTYGQFRQWAKNINDRTGQKRVALPAGTNGLINRFFQGYLLPSFSGGVVTTFKGKAAANGWQYMRSQWRYLHPQSLSYNFMQDPLLSGEVWVAWDHVARLVNA